MYKLNELYKNFLLNLSLLLTLIYYDLRLKYKDTLIGLIKKYKFSDEHNKSIIISDLEKKKAFNKNPGLDSDLHDTGINRKEEGLDLEKEKTKYEDEKESTESIDAIMAGLFSVTGDKVKKKEICIMNSKKAYNICKF